MRSIIIYTPTYERSPGTQYRIDMLMKSLKSFQFHPELVVDKESILRAMYKYLSDFLLDKKTIWDHIGKYIAKKLEKFRNDTSGFILVHDVTSCASKYLKGSGSVIVSIEDLTYRYNKKIRQNREISKNFKNNLCNCLTFADYVITPSYTLTKYIKEECGINAITLPIGLEPKVSVNDALQRPRPFSLTHSRWIKDRENCDLLRKIVNNLVDHRIYIYKVGCAQSIKNKNVIFYKFPSSNEASYLLKNVHFGLVIETNDYFTLSTFYFHTQLLQPMIAILSNRLKEELSQLNIKYIDLNETEKLTIDDAMYMKYVTSLNNIIDNLSIPYVHHPLIRLIR